MSKLTLSKDSSRNGAAAPLPPPHEGLEGIPYLGPARRTALTEAGLRSLSDLRAATVEQIGDVKGVGRGIAAKVKQWLEATPAPSAAIADNPDAPLASANQDVQDVFQKIGAASAKLKEHLPNKLREKALDKQLDKLDTVASEMAEGPDTLSAKRVLEAVKTLDKIAALLEAAAAGEKLSPKKQAVLIEELRARRKRLQKTLGD